MNKIVGLLIFVLTSTVFALPQYYNTLRSQIPGGQQLAHKCVTCHASGGSPALNLFGQDYYSVFRAPDENRFPGIKEMTLAQKWNLLLKEMDSNHNEVSNFDDIVAKVNPGVVAIPVSADTTAP